MHETITGCSILFAPFCYIQAPTSSHAEVCPRRERNGKKIVLLLFNSVLPGFASAAPCSTSSTKPMSMPPTRAPVPFHRRRRRHAPALAPTATRAPEERQARRNLRAYPSRDPRPEPSSSSCSPPRAVLELDPEAISVSVTETSVRTEPNRNRESPYPNPSVARSRSLPLSFSAH